MNVFSRALLLAAAFGSATAQAQVPPMMPDGTNNPATGPMQGQVPGAQQGFPQQGAPQGGGQGVPQQPARAASPVLPPMGLSRQFAGPLPETAIQRFIDPETGVLCYLYTPYRVPHERNENGVLIYGPNNIGSISCVAPGAVARPAPAEALAVPPAGPPAAPGAASTAPGSAARGAAATTKGGSTARNNKAR